MFPGKHFPLFALRICFFGYHKVFLDLSRYGGHTGGAYDTMPEVCLLDAFFRGKPDKFVPVLFDEAGHRVATQYCTSSPQAKKSRTAFIHILPET
jgi:hypothetical protein